MITTHYRINKDAPNEYSFTTDKKVKYYLIFKPSGIVYQNENAKNINVLELSLLYKAKKTNPVKDNKTIRTLILFIKSYFQHFDVIYLQAHNRLEHLENLKKRRGSLRVKLWIRIMNRYFSNLILLSNVNQQKKEDIPCLFVRKDSIHLEQIKISFDKFI